MRSLRAVSRNRWVDMVDLFHDPDMPAGLGAASGCVRGQQHNRQGWSSRAVKRNIRPLAAACAAVASRY